MMMQGKIMDESISDLTSTSGELSAYSAGGATNPPPSKRKRSLPGNPDPEAEVIAMSPKSLLATNRFLCEICNKGFQRDQNLQLHRRGHNLPWKLKQRSKTEVIRKKVYVCPEGTCVHHDPSRALGDLTGIKKHFFRKHGEKKWKCEKCSKRYAVQSDWKAHSKICGTREYRCDCGTLFSRRDSFITHRAFCDVLAEESARAINNPLLSSHQQQQQQQQASHFVNLQASSVKREQESLHLFSPPPPQNHSNLPSSQMFPVSSLDHQSFSQQNPSSNPNPAMTLLASPFQASSASAAHMSATALLQKAAQMGVTMSNPHMPGGGNYSCGPVMSSRDEIGTSGSWLASFWNKAAMEQFSVAGGTGGEASHLVHGMMSSFSPANGFVGASSFEDDDFNGILSSNPNPNPNSDRNFQDHHHLNFSKPTQSSFQSQSNGIDDGMMTRDFLGLKGFPRKEFLNSMAGGGGGQAGHHIHSSSSTYGQRNQNQLPPWQG